MPRASDGLTRYGVGAVWPFEPARRELVRGVDARDSLLPRPAPKRRGGNPGGSSCGAYRDHARRRRARHPRLLRVPIVAFAQATQHDPLERFNRRTRPARRRRWHRPRRPLADPARRHGVHRPQCLCISIRGVVRQGDEASHAPGRHSQESFPLTFSVDFFGRCGACWAALDLSTAGSERAGDDDFIGGLPASAAEQVAGRSDQADHTGDPTCSAGILASGAGHARDLGARRP